MKLKAWFYADMQPDPDRKWWQFWKPEEIPSGNDFYILETEDQIFTCHIQTQQWSVVDKSGFPEHQFSPHDATTINNEGTENG